MLLLRDVRARFPRCVDEVGPGVGDGDGERSCCSSRCQCISVAEEDAPRSGADCVAPIGVYITFSDGFKLGRTTSNADCRDARVCRCTRVREVDGGGDRSAWA